MTIGRWGVVAILTGLASASIAAEPEEMRYDCDTTPGHFSQFAMPQAPGRQSLSGVITAQALYRGGQWQPTAHVRLVSADGDSWVGVRLTAKAQTKAVVQKGAVVRVEIAYRTGKKAVVADEVGMIPLGQGLPYALTVAGEQVRVRVGESEQVVPLALGDQRKVMLACSTGDFLFTAMPAH
ncbi:hypothetical protein ACMT1E_09250 [Sphingomonas flavalba]|uniref:hypothetical protein n=1 Tax=Sphingomonas flavalba TaxID=2559804 RepID=UPI0039E176B8